MTNETSPSATSLRQLSRDFSDGKMTLAEYRSARGRLLDDIASGATPLYPYQPPLPSLAAQVAARAEADLSATEPTLQLNRPSRLRGMWVVIVVIALFIFAVLAGILR
ncbi:MAG: hypothetical protein NFCOHLIN_00377 [Gammaproteobacteria bacterium]|nr:hypothetical protein [Gammaproteobacteria bacterium]